MEDRLRRLVEAYSPQHRARWLAEWKGQGGKVVGSLCSYVPEEVVEAAGMLSWRIPGVWQESIPRAKAYYPQDSCSFAMRVVELMLSGALDALDFVVATDWSDDTRRLHDIWLNLGKAPAELLHVPHVDSELGYQAFAKEIARLARRLEDLAGVKITAEALRQSIVTHNEMRETLRKLYELRKRPAPPVTGAEVVGITTAAMVMPKRAFTAELAALLPYLAERKPPLPPSGPRLMVSSDKLDDPRYVALIEQLGCVVAMDDSDTGSRYFWQAVDTAAADPIEALASRYVSRPACPRMYAWERQAAQVVAWAKEFAVDGVVELPVMRSRPREGRVAFFRERLQEAGIPIMSFRREYHLANVGQLKTRIGAFVETLQR